MGDWQRIGCALDFSDGSRAAVSQAEALATRFGAELVLFHALELVTGSDEGARREMAEKLETWRVGAAQATGRSVEAVLLEGPAAPAIAKAAAGWKLDLLVTGTHGRRGFRHMVLGSVAERLVHLAPCAVLVVRT
jgi:nucleotide-binding universal stress UspA family protein